jgi:hypothetical protein
MSDAGDGPDPKGETDENVERVHLNLALSTSVEHAPAVATEGRRLGGAVATVVAGVVVVALGAAVGYPTATALASLGGVLAGRSLGGLVEDATARKARGSLVLVVGLAVGVAGVALTASTDGSPTALVAALGVAPGFAAAAAVDVDDDAYSPLVGVCFRSATVLGAGAVLAAVVHNDLFARGAVAVSTAGVGFARLNIFMLVVTLQVSFLLAVGLVERAVPILEEWTDDDAFSAVWAETGVGLRDVPPQYGAAVAVQAGLALVGPVADLFEAALSTLGPVGGAVRFALYWGVFHLPLVAVCLLAGAVLLARALQRGVLVWAGRDPPRGVAYAVGGLAVAIPMLFVAAIPPLDALVTDLVADATAAGATVRAFGPAALALAYGAGLLAVGWLLVAVSPLPATFLGLGAGRGGYAVAAAVLFATALIAGALGAFAPVVFAGVAAALLVYDLGANASDLRTTLGPTADVRDGEATHVVGAVVVGFVGVVLATLALFVLGPVAALVPAATDSTRAVTVLVLALVAFAALGSLVTDHDGDGGQP